MNFNTAKTKEDFNPFNKQKAHKHRLDFSFLDMINTTTQFVVFPLRTEAGDLCWPQFKMANCFSLRQTKILNEIIDGAC